MNKLERLREQAGLSKAEVARRVGVSPATVRRHERGGAVPPGCRRRYADLYHATEFQLTGEPPPRSDSPGSYPLGPGEWGTVLYDNLLGREFVAGQKDAGWLLLTGRGRYRLSGVRPEDVPARRRELIRAYRPDGLRRPYVGRPPRPPAPPPPRPVRAAAPPPLVAVDTSEARSAADRQPWQYHGLAWLAELSDEELTEPHVVRTIEGVEKAAEARRRRPRTTEGAVDGE